MKLIARNTKGTLHNGTPYQIKLITDYDRCTEEYFIQVNTYTGTPATYNHDLSVRESCPDNDYKHCLGSLLTQLQNKLSIPLLKTQFKEA